MPFPLLNSLSPDSVGRSALGFKVQISSSYKRKFDSITSSDKLVSPILQSTSNLPISAKRYTQAKCLIKQQLMEISPPIATIKYNLFLHKALVETSTS